MSNKIFEMILYLQQEMLTSVFYGAETIIWLGLKIWNVLPKNIKDSQNIKI